MAKILGIFGLQGSGKTMYLTYLGKRDYEEEATGRNAGNNMMINLHQWRTGEYGDGIKDNESFTLDQGSGRDYCIINGAVRSGGRGSLERHQWDIVEQGNNIRRLTPVECERLQGFPDGWTEGISDTQRYKCLGNAVTVNVIETIGKSILNHSVEG